MTAIASSVLVLVAMVGAILLFWPRLRRRLIVSERAPGALREFAASSLAQNGLLKLALYLALLPLVDVRLPRHLLAWLCRTIGKQQGLDFSELDRPVEDFPTLNAFFARPLRPECRPICAEADAIVAPADADLTQVGRAEADRIILAKGAAYSLDDLLPVPEARAFAGGSYAVMYLRPGNCHRVFCPDRAVVKAAIRIPGREMPVAPAVASLVGGVLVQNRRVAHLLEGPRGRMALIMIGAYKVGEIVPEYDPEFSEWDSPAVARRDYALTPVVELERGQWMATFYLGSAIVLLFEPGTVGEFGPAVGTRLKYGERLATWKG